jgi:hypothetical protein
VRGTRKKARREARRGGEYRGHYQEGRESSFHSKAAKRGMRGRDEKREEGGNEH